MFLFSQYIVYQFSIKCFCCFLLLVHLLTFNIQHSKTCNQHHPYTIFGKTSSFKYFIFGHIRLEYGTLITWKGVFILHFQVNRMSALIKVPEIRFKATASYVLRTMQGLVEYGNHQMADCLRSPRPSRRLRLYILDLNTRLRFG